LKASISFQTVGWLQWSFLLKPECQPSIALFESGISSSNRMKEFHMFKSFYLRQQAKTSESLIAKEAEFFLQALS
jgi:hypothetical protein